MMRVSNAMTRCCAGVGVMLVGALTPHLARAQDIRPLVQAFNASGLDVFHQLAARPGNILFSPYSVGSAMAMARSGARGATEAEMASALHQHFLAPRLKRQIASFSRSSTAMTRAQPRRVAPAGCSGPASDANLHLRRTAAVP